LSCIALAKGESKHSKAKHIDLSFHWNQDILSKGGIELKFVPSKWQLADSLTKVIGPEKFAETLEAWKVVSPASGSVEIENYTGESNEFILVANDWWKRIGAIGGDQGVFM
jgi:hypothetical protein